MTVPSTREVAELLATIGALRFGHFRLKDGRESPFYVDLRGIVGFPKALRKIGEWLGAAAQPIPHDCIAGIPYAGLPLGVAMSLATEKPLVYARKEAKHYGTEQWVEGRFQAGDRVLVVDDVLTSGSAKIEALVPLRGAGLVVTDVLVIVDRQEGGEEMLKQAGIGSHHLITIHELLREFASMELISSADYDLACRFLRKS